MNKASHSLKQRIARSFVFLALVLASFFTFVAYIAVELIEEQVLDARLEKLAGKLIEQHQRKQMPDVPPDVNFYVNTSIPPELQRLPAGSHELLIHGTEIQAVVRTEGTDRFAVVQETTEFEHTEFIIFSALGAGFISSLMLAVILGIATARRIVAPVSALADAVARNENPALLPSLEAADEIGVLARAFAKRTEQLQQFLAQERLFTGDVSHELRTPLTVMLGAAEVLKAQLGDRPEQLAVAERLRRVAADTSERISALLLLSRTPELLDAPRTALHPVIQAELDRCQYLLAGKSVQCRIESAEREVWVDARPELIGIVVGNLLRNACQHTDAGTIAVTLKSDRLIIEDNGPGLPAAVRERLFERFVQGRKDSPEGTGLGLSIVKRVAEHIGWDIRLECPSGGGSRFVLSFQAAQLRPISS
jgi:signal transduction histidine kinase